MKKVLAGFFLPLCIFLLSGFGFTYAYAYQDCTYRTLERTDCAGLDEELNSLALVIKAPSEKESFKIDAADIKENEEDKFETSSSKKHSDSGNNLLTLFFNQSLNLLGLSKNSLQSSKYLSYHLSHKWYLIFGIIRI